MRTSVLKDMALTRAITAEFCSNTFHPQRETGQVWTFKTTKNMEEEEEKVTEER
jgi:hypothetical protein